MSKDCLCLSEEILTSLPDELLKLYLIIWSKEKESKKNESFDDCQAKIKELASLSKKSERQTRANLWKLAHCKLIHVEERIRSSHRIRCTPQLFCPDLLNDCTRKSISPQEADFLPGSELPPRKWTSPPEVYFKPKEGTAPTSVADNFIEEKTLNDCTRKSISPQEADFPPGNELPPRKSISANKEYYLNNIYINTPQNNTKVPPTEKEKGEEPTAETPTDTHIPYRAYKLLAIFKKAAGDKLALGDLISSKMPPEGFEEFQAKLPISLDKKWQELLKRVGGELKFTQEYFEKRIERLGKYVASGQDYRTKRGISLQDLCEYRSSIFTTLLAKSRENWDKPTEPPIIPFSRERIIPKTDPASQAQWDAMDAYAFKDHDKTPFHERTAPVYDLHT